MSEQHIRAIVVGAVLLALYLYCRWDTRPVKWSPPVEGRHYCRRNRRRPLTRVAKRERAVYRQCDDHHRHQEG